MSVLKEADLIRLRAQVGDLLAELDRLIAEDQTPDVGWQAHALAPARSSLAHVEWVLQGNAPG